MKPYYTIALSMLAGAAVGAVAIQSLHAQAKPTAYVIVESDVTNQDAYAKEYAPLVVKALTDGGGKFLVRGGKIVSIEGEPPKSRIILIAFENLEKAQAAFASMAFRDARKTGDKYAKFRIWAVEGPSQ
jgi:uncharacterized protein (DUF1330 family)